MNLEKLNKYIIFINSFFIFSGFQMVLVIFYISGNPELSRFFSIPLRALLLLSILFFLKYNRIQTVQRNNIIALIFFSFLYTLKIFYSEYNSFRSNEMSRTWFEYLFYFYTYCFFTYLFYSSVNYKKYYKLILNSIIISGVLFGIVTIIAYFPYIITGTLGRLSYLKYETGEDTINPLALAYSAVLTISSLIFSITFPRKKISKMSKLFYLFAGIISIIMFSIGSSRGALVTFIVASMSILYYARRRVKIYALLVSVLVIPVFIIINNFVGGDIFERSTNTIRSGGDNFRSQLHHAALTEFENHPIFGGQIEVSGTYPHNIFIEILMSTGLVGFFIFAVFLINHFVKISKYSKRNYIYVYLFVLLLNGIVQYSFSGAIWASILLFFPLGLINSLSMQSNLK